MPCLGLKIGLGAQTMGLGITAVIAVEGMPTVVISAAALAAMAVQFSRLVATMVSLADCLANAGRAQEAETLRREVGAIEKQLKQLQPQP